MLLEWERMKSASEKRWADDMRRRVQEKTGNIFKEFDESARVGLLERLESSVNATKVIELTKEDLDRIIKAGFDKDGKKKNNITGLTAVIAATFEILMRKNDEAAKLVAENKDDIDNVTNDYIVDSPAIESDARKRRKNKNKYGK